MAGLLTCFCCKQPSRNMLPVAWREFIACNSMRNLQQRDCPGFAPDSLLIASFERKEANQCIAKIMKKVTYKNEWRELFLLCQREHKFQSTPLIVLGGDCSTVDNDGVFHDGKSQACAAQFA